MIFDWYNICIGGIEVLCAFLLLIGGPLRFTARAILAQVSILDFVEFERVELFCLSHINDPQLNYVDHDWSSRHPLPPQDRYDLPSSNLRFKKTK